MRRILVAVMTLLLAGCTSNSTTAPEGGSFVFVSPGGKADFSYPVDQRQTIGNFTGTSVTDASKTIQLSDYPDTVMVLNVWGSWCGPCRGEAGDLNVAAHLSAGRPVQFLGINVQDQRDAATDFMTNFAVPFPSIFDPTMRTLLSMTGYPTTGIPHTIILDEQHRVARIFLRPVTAQELDQAIGAVVAEPAPSSAAGPTG